MVKKGYLAGDHKGRPYEQRRFGKLLRRVIWLAAAWFVVFPGGKAAACSLAEPYVDVVCEGKKEFFKNEPICLSEDCFVSIVPVEDEYWGNKDVAYRLMQDDVTVGVFTETEFSHFGFAKIDFHLIDSLCIQNFEKYLSEFEELYEHWIASPHPKYFHIEMYSEESVEEIQSVQNNLMDCETIEYNQVGNWLVSYDVTREYCYSGSIMFIGPPCPISRVNMFALLIYLISNPSTNIIGFVVSLGIIGGIGMSGVYLIRRGELGTFLKLSGWRFWVVILALPFILIGLGRDYIYTIWTTLLYYLILAIIDYRSNLQEESS